MSIGENAHHCAAVISGVAITWLLAEDGENVAGLQEAAEAYMELYDSGLELIAQVAAYTTAATMQVGDAPICGDICNYLQQLSDIANSTEAEPVVLTKEMQHLEKCLTLN
jgi:hypothetical protein